jgi:nanoRNase/pAp phosphatase (c-di-AMP/oligoRNAs hydrolase)
MPESFKQVANQLNTAQSVLIVLPHTPSPDSVAAGLGLVGFLENLGRRAALVSPGNAPDSRLNFLSGYDHILRELEVAKMFNITVSTKRIKLDELSYKKINDSVSILLKPKAGEFGPEDITLESSKLPYDLVVVLGAIELEDLGPFYGKNTSLFFELPVINVDFKGANKNFGQFNLVVLNASSLSEIVFDLLVEMGQDYIMPEAATALLAGIIFETNSFQNARTTPQAFVKSSRLVGLGGEQQIIINSVYKNKSMGFLRLWGSVLAKLVHEPENNLVHSHTTATDLGRVGASIMDALSVHDEMRQQLGFAKVHLYFMESGLPEGKKETRVHASGPQSIALEKILSQFDPHVTWPSTVRFTVPLPLVDAQELVLQLVRPESQKLS